MPGVSIHVVDVVRGVPAVGLRVALHALAGTGRREIGAGTIGANGQLEHPMSDGAGIREGAHEVVLQAGDWYRAAGLLTDRPAFQEEIVFRFTVLDLVEHYHLPIKMSPWGLSIWRGR
jgi:5-hydroxyisourate hydrolase